MSRGTSINFALVCVWCIVGLACTITTFLNWGHVIFALGGWAFAWLSYTDGEDGTESVRDYFKRKGRA